MQQTIEDIDRQRFKRRNTMVRNLEGTGLEGYREEGEVAARFNRSTKTIRRWRQQGLRHIKVSGAVFIADRDIAAFFEKHAVGGNMPRVPKRTTATARAASGKGA